VESKQLLIGLPGTGKSTFLAALWFEAERGETQWAISDLGPDLEHLNALTDRWLRCDAIERSALGREAIVSMQFADRESRQIVRVFFPDLAGETFEDQWVSRHCSKEYFEIARETDRVLLFIHPQKLRQGERIEDFLEVAGEEREGKAEALEVPRQPERDPTQVILVDLLQILTWPPISHDSLKVAVLLSAWDLVEREQQAGGVPRVGPDRWFSNQLPLLDQFLKSNADCVQFRVFGVSAQGGDYEDANEREKLLQMANPVERIGMVASGSRGHDLTAPLTWLAQGRSDSPTNADS